LLVFAVSFGVLDKIKLFGEQSKGPNLVIGFIFGLLFRPEKTIPIPN